MTFFVSYGISECTQASYNWYLDDVLIGTENPLVLTLNNINTHSMRVVVTEYTEASWLGGNFYGGNFREGIWKRNSF